MSDRIAFPVPLRVEWIDGNTWVILEPFTYIARDGEQIDVHAGFVTDFASVPRLFWIIFPKTGRYGRPALLHDFAYTYPNGRTRAEVDDLFRSAMEDIGIGWLTRILIHRAVRIGGGGAWARQRAEDVRRQTAA